MGTREFVCAMVICGDEMIVKARDNLIWIDNIKVIACVLVALGHFMQSMVSAELIENSGLCKWFVQTVYYFHVELFFICSGFLYQKYTVTSSLSDHIRNIFKKFLNLGIPYFMFSIVTWLLKTVFSGSVNTEVGGLFYSLFVHPLSPYWYLFALFFIYALTPTFRSEKCLVVWTLVMFLVKIFINSNQYSVSIILENWIWFLLGMLICKIDFQSIVMSIPKLIGIGSLLVFLLCSVGTYLGHVDIEVVSFLLGALACYALLIMSIQLSTRRSWLAPYTMGIYLMHTIFAAGIRSVLLKLGIVTPVIHIPAGLVVSFLGPCVAVQIMMRTKLDFLIKPSKYIQIS